MAKTITYLTATYNRADELIRLYSSLRQQSLQNFNWLIIDDGSTDNTEATIKKWIKENNLFKIIYYKRKNGGKHRAINFALPLITSNLTMIIDSDDYLVTDCSKIIESYWKKYQNNSQNVKAFVFEHGISSIKDPMVKIAGEKVAPRYEYVEQNKMYGDYNDVFFTKELKEFRLPEFEGENFISEGPLYFNFSQKYNSLFVGKVIAIGNYGQQGLTNNSRKLKLRNYKGALFDLDLCMGSRTPLYSRIKHGILYDYITVGSNAPFNKMIFLSDHRFLKLLCLLPGIYFYIKDKIMHRI
ncbi:glycosyltransferase family A protein [Limosilactobacillus reuteri]|uniref:glycosyltransferase family A protein n=1 Tax=Limosilactobacillus reuteri TaxID=1598 RepID=UPI002A8D93A4|nr:glycosyltransferase family A protein [Limosilactobacillus reuteri]